MLRWLGRSGLGMLMLCVAVPTVLAAVLILLPPMYGGSGWQVRLVLNEWSLLLVLPAVLSLLLAAAARWSGWRRLSGVIAALAVIALALALLPPARGALAASQAGVRLNPLEYFAGTVRDSVRGPDDTATYDYAAGLKLDVWRPPGQREAGPAVVLVHGGNWTSGGRGWTPRWNAWLADQGFTVFDIDYRLAPPATARTAPADVKHAVGWVRQNATQYAVDPERIVLLGTSAGGHLALLATYTEPDPAPVAAVVAVYAPLELTPWFTDHRPWWYQRRLWDSRAAGAVALTGGTPEQVPEAYRAAEPIRHVHPGLPPTLLVQGGSDLLAPPAPARRLADALTRDGNRVRRVEIEYADHGFDLNWGGIASQITRAEISGFLRSARPSQAEARAPGGGAAYPTGRRRARVSGLQGGEGARRQPVWGRRAEPGPVRDRPRGAD
ncbi:alpha/beta hydrolase [Flindersiella endophytica]